MPAHGNADRMRLVLQLIEEGITRNSALARRCGISQQAMAKWLTQNGLHIEERNRIAAEGAAWRAQMGGGVDPYQELKRAVIEAGSQRALARRTGVHREEIGRVVRGEITIPPQLLQALGLRRVAVYVRTK